MKKNDVDIERVFCPEKDILLIDDGVPRAKIIDEDLDIFECLFDDDAVQIKTDGYSYINLNLRNLKTLIKLIKQAKIFDDNEE